MDKKQTVVAMSHRHQPIRSGCLWHPQRSTMEQKDLIKAKILDKIRQYEKTGECVATSFLTPRRIA